MRQYTLLFCACFGYYLSMHMSNLVRFTGYTAVILVITGCGYFVLNHDNQRMSPIVQENSIDTDDFMQQHQETKSSITPSETKAKKGTPRIFAGNEFRLLYENILYQNIDQVDVPPAITENVEVDAYIRQIAESRGYKLRSEATEKLVALDVGILVQSDVAAGWQQLQDAAAKDGFSLIVTSGYRSIDDQRKLFLGMLSQEIYPFEQVLSGERDEDLHEVLKLASLPGYSKHHTGYAIDVKCRGYNFYKFAESPCFEWLAAENYKNAKQYGFIPSYPDDADLQGPDPEAWEYVWVGQDLLQW